MSTASTFKASPPSLVETGGQQAEPSQARPVNPVTPQIVEKGVSTRARIAILIFSMTNAVLFGIGIVIVLNVPSLAAHAGRVGAHAKTSRAFQPLPNDAGGAGKKYSPAIR